MGHIAFKHSTTLALGLWLLWFWTIYLGFSNRLGIGSAMVSLLGMSLCVWWPYAISRRLSNRKPKTDNTIFFLGVLGFATISFGPILAPNLQGFWEVINAPLLICIIGSYFISCYRIAKEITQEHWSTIKFAKVFLMAAHWPFAEIWLEEPLRDTGVFGTNPNN